MNILVMTLNLKASKRNQNQYFKKDYFVFIFIKNIHWHWLKEIGAFDFYKEKLNLTNEEKWVFLFSWKYFAFVKIQKLIIKKVDYHTIRAFKKKSYFYKLICSDIMKEKNQ